MLNISVMEINLLEVPATLFIFCLYPLQSQKVLKSVTKETNSLYKYWNNVYHILSRLWTHRYTSTDDINFVTFSTSWGRPTINPKTNRADFFTYTASRFTRQKVGKLSPRSQVSIASVTPIYCPWTILQLALSPPTRNSASWLVSSGTMLVPAHLLSTQYLTFYIAQVDFNWSALISPW